MFIRRYACASRQRAPRRYAVISETDWVAANTMTQLDRCTSVWEALSALHCKARAHLEGGLHRVGKKHGHDRELPRAEGPPQRSGV